MFRGRTRLPAGDAIAPFHRRKFLWTLGGTLGLLGIAAAGYSTYERPRSPLDLLWQPIFATKAPLIIFVPILTASDGTLTDRVGIGTEVTVRHAADYLTRHDYPYHLRFGADLTFSQLREQPSLLLGGFCSRWTSRMTHGLRFSLVGSDNADTVAGVYDAKSKRLWQTMNRRPDGYADQDYAILCRLFDSASGQIVMLAAGVTTFGTEGASSLLFEAQLFSEVIKQAPPNWAEKNFQAVVRVGIIGTSPSVPQLVASEFW